LGRRIKSVLMTYQLPAGRGEVARYGQASGLARAADRFTWHALIKCDKCERKK